MTGVYGQPYCHVNHYLRLDVEQVRLLGWSRDRTQELTRDHLGSTGEHLFDRGQDLRPKHSAANAGPVAPYPPLGMLQESGGGARKAQLGQIRARLRQDRDRETAPAVEFPDPSPSTPSVQHARHPIAERCAWRT